MSQLHFKQALLDPSLPAPAGLQDGQGSPAGRHFDVYRNNVTVSLIEALQTGFPAVCKLLGEENFTNLARDYLRAEPPTSPVMMFYGKGFAEFVQGFEPLAKFGYLPDVARFEILLRESYHAADADVITPVALGAIAPERLGGAKLVLAPSTRLLQSPWPVLSFWQYALKDGAPRPSARPESVLITRPEFDPTPQLLPVGAGGFVRALQLGKNLEKAAAQAIEKNKNFELSTALSTLLSAQAITQVSLEEDT